MDRYLTGVVGDIRRFSLHDGPGIRTTVFFSGCNLRCRWCHNPETYQLTPQMVFVASKCIACRACYDACPTGALLNGENGRVFEKGSCKECYRCVEACYPGALSLSGSEMSTDEVLEEILADKNYYGPSDGGVTISGGEPFMQREFLLSVLEACGNEGIHTSIETNLTHPWSSMLAALQLTDLIMADVKTFDCSAHERWTGLPNEEILANVKRLDELGKPMIIRTPVIPSVNDDTASIGAIAGFLAGMQNIVYYELLNYNELAELKFRSLGLEYSLSGVKRLKPGEMAVLADAARKKAPRLDVRCQV